MSNKPDWKDAPDWANWLAQDEDGEWTWWQSRPTTEEDNYPYWMPTKESCEKLESDFKKAKFGAKDVPWKETLEPRP